MWFQEDFKKNLDNKKSIQQYRYEAARMVFIMMSYVFFIIFFLVASGYYADVLAQFLVPSYIILILTIPLYGYFYGIVNFDSKHMVYILFSLTLLFSLASFAILFI